MQAANEDQPLRRFVVKYHELHTRIIEARTIEEAAKHLEALVGRLAKGSMMLEIRADPEKVVA